MEEVYEVDDECRGARIVQCVVYSVQRYMYTVCRCGVPVKSIASAHGVHLRGREGHEGKVGYVPWQLHCTGRSALLRLFVPNSVRAGHTTNDGRGRESGTREWDKRVEGLA